MTKQLQTQETANLDYRKNLKALVISVLVISIVSLVVGLIKLFR